MRPALFVLGTVAIVAGCISPTEAETLPTMASENVTSITGSYTALPSADARGMTTTIHSIFFVELRATPRINADFSPTPSGSTSKSTSDPALIAKWLT